MPRCVSARRKSSRQKQIPLQKWQRTTPVLLEAKVAADRTADFEKVVPEEAGTVALVQAGHAGTVLRPAVQAAREVPAPVRRVVRPNHGQSAAGLARFTYSTPARRRPN